MLAQTLKSLVQGWLGAAVRNSEPVFTTPVILGVFGKLSIGSPAAGMVERCSPGLNHANCEADPTMPPRDITDCSRDGRLDHTANRKPRGVSKREPPRRLVAVLAADVVGFSALMASDEAQAVADLKRDRRQRFQPAIVKFHGRLINTAGDGSLVEFPSVLDAVRCAISIQSSRCRCARRIVLRIGINIGDVIPNGDEIFGDAVNIAARVEAMTEPGGVWLTSNAYESLCNRMNIYFEDAGEHRMKNIERAVKVFRWMGANECRETKGEISSVPALLEEPHHPTSTLTLHS